MSKTLHSCGPDDTVAYAQELMRRHQVRRIPVIDIDGKLLGILSLGDIARFLGEHPDLESEGIGCDALAETLGALSEPRHRRGRG
jgi:CBS domain-containing protein